MTEQRTIIPGTWAGTLVGLFFGWVWFRYGVVHAAFVLFWGAVGYVIAGVFRGEIDILEGLSRLQQRNRTF